jgi:high-affinity iron transporter
MLQAFIIVLREGFEAFLIVAIILSYLAKRQQKELNSAVYWGVVFSLLVSGVAGYLLKESVSKSFWEGVLGVVTIVLVGSLVVHMWRVGRNFKNDMENRLTKMSSQNNQTLMWLGIFLFTILMITREGMETAVMLIQVREAKFTLGVVLGAVAAATLSYAWVRFSNLINLRRFFQITGIFLLLFLVQVGVYSVHEFSEAGLFPNSEALHQATEVFSPMGLYGKWFSLLNVSICAIWLISVWVLAKVKPALKS